MKLIRLFGAAILAMSITLASCSGEDGKDGINGIDGIDGKDGLNGQDGTDGTDGQDGQDGQNGVGFDEMVQYGSVTLNLSGTRPDGVAFEDTNTFKFTPPDGDFLNNNNHLVETDLGNNDINYYFEFTRFLSTPDNINNNSHIYWGLDIDNIGEATELLNGAAIYLDSYAVIGDDSKYFTLTDYFGSGNNGVSDFQFTDLIFDAEDNNHLTFSYSFEVLAANNDSGNDLTVSGTVDVYLLEEITP